MEGRQLIFHESGFQVKTRDILEKDAGDIFIEKSQAKDATPQSQSRDDSGDDGEDRIYKSKEIFFKT